MICSEFPLGGFVVYSVHIHVHGFFYIDMHDYRVEPRRIDPFDWL